MLTTPVVPIVVGDIVLALPEIPGVMFTLAPGGLVMVVM